MTISKDVFLCVQAFLVCIFYMLLILFLFLGGNQSIWTAAFWILSRTKPGTPHAIFQVCPLFEFNSDRQLDAIQPYIQCLIWFLKLPNMKRGAGSVSKSIQVHLFGWNTSLLICSAWLTLLMSVQWCKMWKIYASKSITTMQKHSDWLRWIRTNLLSSA